MEGPALGIRLELFAEAAGLEKEALVEDGACRIGPGVVDMAAQIGKQLRLA